MTNMRYGFLLPLPLKASQIGKLILIWMANPLKRFWQVPLASFYRIQVLSLYCLITQSLCCLLPKQSKIFCVSVKFLMEHLDNKEKGGGGPCPNALPLFADCIFGLSLHKCKCFEVFLGWIFTCPFPSSANLSFLSAFYIPLQFKLLNGT